MLLNIGPMARSGLEPGTPLSGELFLMLAAGQVPPLPLASSHS